MASPCQPTLETKAEGALWRCLRDEAYLSGPEVVERLGSQPASVDAIEGGEVRFDIGLMQRLADIYGVDLVGTDAHEMVTLDTGVQMAVRRRAVRPVG